MWLSSYVHILTKSLERPSRVGRSRLAHVLAPAWQSIPAQLPDEHGFDLWTYLPLASREWRNGVQLQLLLLPFFHSLLTKGRLSVGLFSEGFKD